MVFRWYLRTQEHDSQLSTLFHRERRSGVKERLEMRLPICHLVDAATVHTHGATPKPDTNGHNGHQVCAPPANASCLYQRERDDA